jgi:hypothetical protein
MYSTSPIFKSVYMQDNKIYLITYSPLSPSICYRKFFNRRQRRYVKRFNFKAHKKHGAVYIFLIVVKLNSVWFRIVIS